MPEGKEGIGTLSKETQEVLGELEKEGFEIEGKEPEKKPEEKPKEEPPKEPEKAPEKEPEGEERKPREPKFIPAWQAEIEKKRLQKEWEDKTAQGKTELVEQIKNLKSEFEEFKKTHPSTQISDKKDDIEKQLTDLAGEYGIEEGFVKKLYGLLPKPKEYETPAELKEKLAKIDEIEAQARQRQEDIVFESSFSEKIVSKLRESYKDISEEEIGIIKAKIRDDYFSERYINLDADEIYAIKQDSYKEFVNPQRPSPEKGTRGVGRGVETVDYGNLTDEQYAQMPSEEQEKVNEYLRKKGR